MIFFRYISKEFIRYYSVTTMVFMAIFILVDFIEKNPRVFLKYDASWENILLYYIYALPSQYILFSPLAVLLAVLITLILLGRNLEIIAMRACGQSLVKIAQPLFIISLLIFLINVVVINGLIPITSHKYQAVDRKIRQKKSSRKFLDKHWMRHENSFYHIGKFSSSNTRLTDISIFQLSPNFILGKRIEIKKASWDKKKKIWNTEDAVITSFSSAGTIRDVKSQKKGNIPLAGEPKDFSFEEKKPDSMSYFELNNFIDKSRKEGIDVSELIVELHLKFSYPFINIIMCLLGIPFALR